MSTAKGYAAPTAKAPLEPFSVPLRHLRPDDVLIAIKFCGVCHSDIHKARNEWGGARFPMVPGHEIVGEIVEAGMSVRKFEVGQRVGVGCFVNCCGDCGQCKRQMEPYCSRSVPTYNALDHDGSPVYGGYAKMIVCKERFVFRMPTNLDMAASAPLLCAGITMWSPITHLGLHLTPKRVGVLGLGGLGHMGVKLCKALGCEVTVLSRTPSKFDEATKRLGADRFVCSTDAAAMLAAAKSLDVILDSVSAKKDLAPYLALLDIEGVFCTVGLPEKDVEYSFVPKQLICKRQTLIGSLVGGTEETQAMLDFCGEKGIVCDIEMIRMDEINKAFDRVVASDVRYRFVIDMESF
ncbi:MAG: hypothetical protein KVP17_003790 [Porospora cf. gigantea B]|uniref:uncharacterized protein n=1 Tax=Porospora cf. gigantea B TaxID=2853592 RepID=UPI0035717C80|nr:MAG: hypothetical protein KVP17_003790 [Porospora cf. gigantea B]